MADEYAKFSTFSRPMRFRDCERLGDGRTGKYIHHLRIARGSGCELNTQLELSERLGLLVSHQVASIVDQTNEVGRMLSGLIRSLEQRNPNS